MSGVLGEDGIMTVSIGDGERGNALTAGVLAGLSESLGAAAGAGVSAVILTGRGATFSVGQDLTEVMASEMPAADRLRRFYRPVIEALWALEKPTVAAIQGPCVGAALALAAACDVRLAAPEARFVPGFAALGLVPDAGCSWLLPRLLGFAAAYEWLTTGHVLDAEAARRLGLINDVVDGDRLGAFARDRASRLAAPGPAAVLTKRLLRQADVRSLTQQLSLEEELQDGLSRTDAHRQAVQTFLSSRRA